MRVVLLSYAYAPSIGGIESVSALVASGLRDLGHQVTVVTFTPGDVREGVVREPGRRQLIHILRDADVVLQSHLSLRLSWPLVIGLVRRPWVVVLHGESATQSLRARATWKLKELTLPRSHTYAVSDYLTTRIHAAKEVLPNPVDVTLFARARRTDRLPVRHIAFVGRLVTAKGVDTLLRAVAQLHSHDSRWRLTVVGDGPERAHLEWLTTQLRLEGTVEFVGGLVGDELARRLSQHHILAIPSQGQPAEAFGVVALEAIAAGVVPVASDDGGLPEAVGPCGPLFDAGDAAALAQRLTQLAQEGAVLDKYREHAAAHLHTYSVPYATERYERALLAATKPRALS